MDWDNCVEYVSYNENPEETKINITNCKTHPYYDWTHDCRDGILDITKCMEGNTSNLINELKISSQIIRLTGTK